MFLYVLRVNLNVSWKFTEELPCNCFNPIIEKVNESMARLLLRFMGAFTYPQLFDVGGHDWVHKFTLLLCMRMGER